MKQFEAVGIWFAVFPLAVVPLWQLAQFVEALKPPWSGLLAGSQADVLWQLSHDDWVAMWPEGLPEEIVPLWHEAQVPVTTPVWLNLAPANDLVVWQVSQAAWVGRCCWGFTTLFCAIRKPVTWQLAQSLGVPLKTPLRWQDSHRAVVCCPLRAKPV